LTHTVQITKFKDSKCKSLTDQTTHHKTHIQSQQPQNWQSHISRVQDRFFIVQNTSK